MASKARVSRIVITGGPCSGKTTLLTRLVEPLREFRFQPYLVPEVASLLIAAGGRTRETVGKEMLRFQIHVVRVQLAVEDGIFDIATSRRDSAVIVHDRGVIDAAGFLPPKLWARLLNNERLTVPSLMERYDQVIHLETAPPQFYTKKNNESRLESLDEAYEADGKILAAWNAHPSLGVITRRNDFEAKMREAVAVVCEFLASKST